MNPIALQVSVSCEADLWIALAQASRMAEAADFGPMDTSRLKTATAELGRNILKYAGYGQLVMQMVAEPGQGWACELSAIDQGPGIANIAQAMQDNFSSGGTLGLGLPGVRRLADAFKIESTPGQGTQVHVRFVSRQRQ